MYNNAPNVFSEHFAVAAGSVYSGAVRVHDVDEEALTVSLVRAPEKAAVDESGELFFGLVADGSFWYKPTDGSVGPDYFVFAVSDGIDTVTGEAYLWVHDGAPV
ncbi:MAG: Ig-like domain-containing protein, partial [Candidatus Methanomethylicaceae archaeon]